MNSEIVIGVQVSNEYEKNGYLVAKGFFEEKELRELREAVRYFHESWKKENADFYAERAINSAGLTGKKHLRKPQRELLFKLIGSSKLMGIVASIMNNRPTFMNTQLFFNPVNTAQKNYWHRDAQYHLSVDEQKEALAGLEVIHFRIPLVSEPGIELVPGTHKRWDTSEELDVRLEQNGRRHYDDLSTGVKVNLVVGDLLVFSANMIHRGLYGMERLSLDILFCDPEPSLMKFVDDDHLPSQAIIKTLENSDAFNSAIEVKDSVRATSE